MFWITRVQIITASLPCAARKGADPRTKTGTREMTAFAMFEGGLSRAMQSGPEACQRDRSRCEILHTRCLFLQKAT